MGVLLYEGITGRLPFTGESMADLLVSVFQHKVEPPTALRTDCPPELERIVLTAMSRDPAMRPHSADQMSRALDQLGGQRQEAGTNLTGLGRTARAAGDPPPCIAGVPPTCARCRTWARRWSGDRAHRARSGSHGWPRPASLRSC